MPIVYKICPAADWRRAEAEGTYAGSPADRRDGFIHLSARHQVRETAGRHFHGIGGLVLIGLDAAALGPALKWEKSRGGDLFPHLYGPILPASVLAIEPLPWNGTGHDFPESVA